jgi:hypothetical protein
MPAIARPGRSRAGRCSDSLGPRRVRRPERPWPPAGTLLVTTLAVPLGVSAQARAQSVSTDATLPADTTLRAALHEVVWRTSPQLAARRAALSVAESRSRAAGYAAPPCSRPRSRSCRSAGGAREIARMFAAGECTPVAAPR